MRAVIYARYSSEHQRAASIEDQVRICKERVAREGWEVVQVFQDRAISGASTLRPGYQALLAGARDGAFDVVVAEALDRLSRDQEDVAGLFKRLRFGGIRIVTLAEGEVSELHVGLKGTMNALFLRDLAAKTHRGMRGRVEAGMSGGGLTYGYRVVHRLNADGTLATGEREIDEAEAAVVTRIFENYAAGVPPKKIALALNADGISAPRGGGWTGSTINGNRARGTGILNNEIYVGRLVWNRLTYMKDPETGRRRSRARLDAEIVVKQVPELRIVTDDLWEAARQRQARLDAAASTKLATTAADGVGASTLSPTPFWQKQRPRFLFSGMMTCGACGSGFSKISAKHFGCAGARLKGPTTCTMLQTIRQDVLEGTVMEALRQRMMAPEVYRAFVQEFTVEWNRMQREASGEQDAKRSELDGVRRQIDRLVDSLANGTPIAAVTTRLTALEARRITLEADLVAAGTPAPYLHPNLADIYRDRLASLAASLQSDDAAEAREVIRGLVETITITQTADGLRIGVRGELAKILGLTGKNAGRAEDLSEQIKMVAGVGFEPTTFRL